MEERKSMLGVLRRVVLLTSGATLLQVTGCTIDQTLLTELADLVVQLLVTSLGGTATP